MTPRVHKARGALALVSALAVYRLCHGAVIHVADVALEPGAEAAAVTVSLAPGPGEEIAAVQFDLAYDPAVLSTPGETGVATGAAAERAQKMAAMATLKPGIARIIIAGFNRNVIAGGPLARVTFAAKPDAAAGSRPITLQHILLSDPNGGPVPASGEDGGIAWAAVAEAGSGQVPPRVPRSWGAVIAGVLVLAAAGYAANRHGIRRRARG